MTMRSRERTGAAHSAVLPPLSLLTQIAIMRRLDDEGRARQGRVRESLFSPDDDDEYNLAVPPRHAKPRDSLGLKSGKETEAPFK